MKYVLLALLTLSILIVISNGVSAESLNPPTAPASAEAVMPDAQKNFGTSVLSMLKKALPDAYIEFRKALQTGLAVFCCTFLISMLQAAGCTSGTANMAGTACVAGLLLSDSRVLIGLAVETVTEIGEYSKLFLPVLTTAASARGAMTSAAALYVGTSVVTAFLNMIIRRAMIPAVYLYLAVSIANSAIGEQQLGQMKESVKKTAAWFLKSVLTLFFAYMSVTGAVTGTADKAAVKTAKAAISAVVPVIGKSLADASEALLLSADIAKNTIGVYGIYVFIGIFLVPFLRIGAHYLVLKGTAMLCGIAGNTRLTKLLEDFCAAMGILLGMAGVMCALSVIGTVCFMKGAA